MSYEPCFSRQFHHAIPHSMGTPAIDLQKSSVLGMTWQLLQHILEAMIVACETYTNPLYSSALLTIVKEVVHEILAI